MTLIGSGIAASLFHLPTLASLWQTSYGEALLVKIGLLLAAMLLAAVNLLRTKPRLVARPADSASRPPGSCAGWSAVRSCSSPLQSSRPRCSRVSRPRRRPSRRSARPAHSVGPGPVREVSKNGYRLQFRVAPNRAAVPNAFCGRVTRNGKPVRGADVTASFTMLDMEMGSRPIASRRPRPGVYSHSAPALVMVGHWGLSFESAARRAAVRRPDRRQGKRMKRLLLDVRFKLFAALVSLALGAAACLVVVLFAQSVLG